MLLVITYPEYLEGEEEVINALFDAGLERMHIRKNSGKEEDLQALLRKIKPAYLKKIVIHDHYRLIEKFNLGGIHLKESGYRMLDSAEVNELIRKSASKNLKVSLSIHDRNDLEKVNESFAYLFLSPVFESISKPGHKPAGALKPLDASIKNPVIALGGVDADNLASLGGYNFSGAAVLGALWEEYMVDRDRHKLIRRFIELKDIAQSVEWKQKDLMY